MTRYGDKMILFWWKMHTSRSPSLLQKCCFCKVSDAMQHSDYVVCYSGDSAWGGVKGCRYYVISCENSGENENRSGKPSRQSPARVYAVRKEER